jgi:hypothetical protein
MQGCVGATVAGRQPNTIIILGGRLPKPGSLTATPAWIGRPGVSDAFLTSIMDHVDRTRTVT